MKSPKNCFANIIRIGAGFNTGICGNREDEMKRHEKELEQYFEDWKNHDEPWELWEIKTFCRAFGETGYWTTWKTMESLDVVYFGNQDCEFRRKQETRKICGWDLPKPLEVEPEVGEIIWVLSPAHKDGYFGGHYSRIKHENYLKNDCLHSTEKNVKVWAAWWWADVMGRCI